jgi:hypothetical protein
LEALGVEACDLIVMPDADYSVFVHEVPLSRLNLARAPERVLTQQYFEVTVLLTGATIGVDPSGRITADDVAIDSSPMNQAIYRELMVHDELVAKDKKGRLLGYDFDLTPTGFGELQLAAMALGVAGDKTTPIGIHTIAYINRIYGIPAHDDLVRSTLESDAGEEFIDYGGFSYDRGSTYDGCWIGYVFDGTTTKLEQGSIKDLVFNGFDTSGTNITGFARWADDARRVNLFIHDSAGTVAVDDLGSTAVCDLIAQTSTTGVIESVGEAVPGLNVML